MGEIRIRNTMRKKICSKCKNRQLISEFYSHKGHNDSLSSICKKCDKKQHKQWLSEHHNKCIDCDKSIFYKSIRCYSCENKRKHKLGLTGYTGKLKQILIEIIGMLIIKIKWRN